MSRTDVMMRKEMKLMSRTDVQKLTPLTDSGIKFEGCSVMAIVEEGREDFVQKQGRFRWVIIQQK